MPRIRLWIVAALYATKEFESIHPDKFVAGIPWHRAIVYADDAKSRLLVPSRCPAPTAKNVIEQGPV